MPATSPLMIGEPPTYGPLGAVDALADAGRGREILCQTIPELRSGTWRLLAYEVTGVRRSLGKQIVACQISYRNGTRPHAASAAIVAKVYRGDRGAPALRALRQLWEAGFRPPARHRVPRPYGYSPERGALFQALVPGTPWAAFLGGDPRSLSEASARAAGWLARLQRTAIQVEAEEPVHDVARWRRVATELASRFPHHAPRLGALAERLLPPLQSWDGLLVPSHGDYHPENVFLEPGFTTAIDHDHLGRREAAFDVGYAIAQLLIMSYFRTGRFMAGANAARAFWRRYAHTGPATWPRVRVHVARAFLQSLHYELCVLRRNPDNCGEVLDLWPDLVERWLESYGPSTLEDLVRYR